MNSHIAVDLHENVVITTDICPTADELTKTSEICRR